MKKLLLYLIFWVYRKDYSRPISKIDEDIILTKLATTPGLEQFPMLLKQYADTARNQYMYSKDDIFKGVVLAFITLRQQIIKLTPKKEKVLTDEEKVAIMKKRGY